MIPFIFVQYINFHPVMRFFQLLDAQLLGKNGLDYQTGLIIVMHINNSRFHAQ